MMTSPRTWLGTSLGALLAASLGCGADDPVPSPTFSVSGDAIPFSESPDGRIEGAEVWILERPEMRVTTGPDGHFHFDGLPSGSEATLVLEHPDYHLIQTATQRVEDADIERVTFQAVTPAIYAALAAIVAITPDELSACQMVTTITRVGKSLYDEGAHGLAGATVTLDPPIAAEHGPIYFNKMVVPQRNLVESSEDGGVLYTQVPPGEYLWTATRPGVTFTPLKMKCRPGVLVNASPPKGLQALE